MDSSPTAPSTRSTSSGSAVGRIPTTAAYFVSYIALGLAAAALGPTLARLAEQTHTSLGEISIVFTTYWLGYLLGSFQGGRLYDRLPGHVVLGSALLLMGVMLALAPAVSALWLLAGVMLVLGVAEGALDVGCNILLVWVHGERVGPFMQALHLFWGIGAFLSPMLIGQLVLASGGIAWAYWTLALVAIPVAVWLYRLPSPADPAESEHVTGGPLNGLLVTLIVMFLFLYVGMESSLSGWLPTYAASRAVIGETMAAFLTSGFWGAFTVGRALAIPFASRVRPRTILFIDLIGCLVGVGMLLQWPNSAEAIWVGVLGLGLSMGSIFATTMLLAERYMAITGQVTGWFFVGGSLGSMLLPWMIGQLIEPIGPRATMITVVIGLIVALLVLGVMVLNAPPERRRRESKT